MNQELLFIGLMSGTSTDGVDAVLADFSRSRPRILAQASQTMPDALREEFLALNRPGPDELARAALAGNALARLYADGCENVLALAGREASDVCAIGAHGQTVRHSPANGYTLQINAPALLAELTGIAVIADFRSRDVAAGGQGAPLVPAFHHAIFGADRPRAVLNLGGIANVTLLHPGRATRGFDTGPANVLMDLWCQRHTGMPYDENGRWAASGTLQPALLEAFIASDPWFALPPPKSTGRDQFNASWLQEALSGIGLDQLPAADIQATLLHLTARTVAEAIDREAPDVDDVAVCGGGARNQSLMGALEHYLQRPVIGSSALGVPEQMVEALAFAWLAWAHETGRPAGLASVTGARHDSVLGCKYPA